MPKTKPVATVQRVFGARVLTNAKCVEILRECEEQKKKEQKEKQKGILKREHKKQERENALKRKAEER